MPNSSCSALLRIRLGFYRFRVRDFYPLRCAFPNIFFYQYYAYLTSFTPRSPSVWALPLSLAATWEIDFSFSSSGYLDVSVPRVSPVRLSIYLTVHTHYCMWVAPFGNLRVDGYLHLTAAYRSLSRPSSAPSAKASALCSFSLDLK